MNKTLQKDVKILSILFGINIVLDALNGFSGLVILVIPSASFLVKSMDNL